MTLSRSPRAHDGKYHFKPDWSARGKYHAKMTAEKALAVLASVRKEEEGASAQTR